MNVADLTGEAGTAEPAQIPDHPDRKGGIRDRDDQAERTDIDACDLEDRHEWQGDSQINDEKRGYENKWPVIGEVSNG